MSSSQQLHSEDKIELVESGYSWLLLEFVLNHGTSISSLLVQFCLFVDHHILKNIEALIFLQVVLDLVYYRLVLRFIHHYFNALSILHHRQSFQLSRFSKSFSDLLDCGLLTFHSYQVHLLEQPLLSSETRRIDFLIPSIHVVVMSYASFIHQCPISFEDLLNQKFSNSFVLLEGHEADFVPNFHQIILKHNLVINQVHCTLIQFVFFNCWNLFRVS